MKKNCELCGKPIPGDVSHNRKYHSACAKIALVEQHREAARNWAARKRNGRSYKRIKRRQHDPMKMLGMDYVTLKLAGLIRIPKS